MNFTPQQRAWILLLALVVGTGSTVVVTSYLGGAKLWVAILVGLGTAGTNVYHALTEKPQNKGLGSGNTEQFKNPPHQKRTMKKSVAFNVGEQLSIGADTFTKLHGQDADSHGVVHANEVWTNQDGARFNPTLEFQLGLGEPQFIHE
jgi:hypothetical protein